MMSCLSFLVVFSGDQCLSYRFSFAVIFFKLGINGFVFKVNKFILKYNFYRV